jgi:GR25 family glycosyltransferase involved in LPS biosynthesis
MKKFVINLKRRPDRLEIFNKQCPFQDVEILYGFDGKNPWSEPSYREKNMLYKLGKLKPGEKGVFLSHMRIFKRIVSDNLSHALIFEDDAIFCQDFVSRFDIIQKEIPLDATILYVGGRFEPEFKMKSCVAVTRHIVRHTFEEWDSDDMERTLHAYIISKDLADILLKEFYGSSVINDAIDSWILKISMKYSISIYSSYPLLCHSPLISNSDIR